MKTNSNLASSALIIPIINAALVQLKKRRRESEVHENLVINDQKSWVLTLS